MSELMDEIKSNLQHSSENLEKLIAEIQGMSDAEKEFSGLKENLGEAAKALAANAQNYEAFLNELKTSNSQFTETLRVLKSLEPKEIKEALDKISASLDAIQSTTQSTIDASNDIMKAQSDSAKNVDEILQKQADAISKLEARLSSRTALVPLIFLIILAIAGAIIGRVLGIV